MIFERIPIRETYIDVNARKQILQARDFYWKPTRILT